MRLWISAEVQGDVYDALHQVRAKFEPKINARLAPDYGLAVKKWALITILRPRISEGWGEVRKYHRARKVVEFRLIIDYQEFKAATAENQLRMLLDSVLRSIDLFPLLKVTGFDADRFRHDIETTAIAEGWIVADTNRRKKAR